MSAPLDRPSCGLIEHPEIPDVPSSTANHVCRLVGAENDLGEATREFQESPAFIGGGRNAKVAVGCRETVMLIILDARIRTDTQMKKIFLSVQNPIAADLREQSQGGNEDQGRVWCPASHEPKRHQAFARAAELN